MRKTCSVLLILSAVILSFREVSAYTVSPFAATGNGPYGITVDSAGNIYVANVFANTVSKITPAGVSTVLGSTGNGPRHITTDSAGNVYTADYSSNTVTKITPSGVSSTLGTTGSGPYAIIADASGNVYTTNLMSSTVTKITPSGVSSTLGTTGSNPYGITIDTAGNVYTANYSSSTVTKITPSGVSSTLGTTGSRPYGIVIDAAGNIYTANANSSNVSKITPAGSSSVFATTGGSPNGIAIDAAGNLYTANVGGGGTVSKITPAGVVTTIGNTSSQAWRLGINSATAEVYITNFSANTVIKLSAPVLTNITPIGTTADTTPDYTFNAKTNATTIVNYGGACTAYAPASTSIAQGDNNKTITFQAMPDGSYSDCTITITDTFGISNQLAIPSFTVDTIAPAVTISSPVNGSAVGITATLTGSCESGLPVAITGTGFTPNPALATCTGGTYTSGVLAVTGAMNVSVAQTDGAGNTGTDSAGYVFDNTAPVLTNVTITSNNTNPSFAQTGNTVTLSWTSDDIPTSQTVTIAGQSVTPSCTGTGPVTCTASLTITPLVPTVDGVIPFSITTTSAGGTTGPTTTTTNSSSVTVDRIAPTLTVSSVGTDSSAPYLTNNTNAPIVIVTTAGDTVTIPGFTCSPTPATGASVTCTKNAPAYTGGTYTVTATITDQAGNATSGPVSLEIDATAPPVPLFEAPSGGNYTTNPTSITGTCETGSTVTLTAAGIQSSPLTVICTGGTFTFPTVTFTTSNPTAVTITQTDAAGNTSAPATQVFSYSQPVSSSGGSGAVLIPTSPIIPTTGTTNTLPTTGTGKTYISPLDNKEYSCTPFTKYLKLNSKTNDATEVKLWQAFLNKHMKENLPITGYYNTLTFNAIKRFQQTYAQDVLTPWGISTPTGWTYKSTRAKGNQILGCSEGRILLDNGVSLNLK